MDIDDEVFAYIPQKMFECSVCLSLLCEPVTLPCGHTFCQLCVLRCFERTNRRCPSCRSPCHISAKGRIVNILISEILKTSWPELYSHRLAEMNSEIKAMKDQIPLFCFPEALFPNQPFRLHFFEPRYILMIQRCLEGNRRFGFFPTDGTQPEIGQVGTFAEIKECTFLANGRSLVYVMGLSRFTVCESWVEPGTQGLWYASVEQFDDEDEEEKEVSITTELRIEMVQKLTESFNDCANDPIMLERIPDTSNLKDVTMWCSAMVPCTMEAKIDLLSSKSPVERFRKIEELVSAESHVF